MFGITLNLRSTLTHQMRGLLMYIMCLVGMVKWQKKTFALINVQYSLGHPGNVKKNIFCDYFACHVHREYRSCQGIKVCEFADPWLFEQHTQVNFDENVYQRVFDQHESMSDNFELRYLYRMSFSFAFIRCN